MGNITTRREEALGATDYGIREAGLEDLPTIASFFRKHNYGLTNADWIQWKYFSNPQGQGYLFLMEDHAGKIAATLGYMPQILTIDRKESIYTMQLVDLFIAPAARGKKLFPRIIEFSQQQFECPIVGFPNKRSEKITLDFGWKKHTPIETWVYPLSFGTESKYRFLDNLLKCYHLFWYPFKSAAVEIRQVDQFRKMPNGNNAIPWSHKEPAFLNWRYIDNPMIQFKCFEFLENNTYIGYCILRGDKGQYSIYDFYVERRLKKCLREIITYCRRQKAHKLFMKGINIQMWKYGFLKLPVSTYLVSHRLTEKRLTLTLGDSDW